MSVTRNTPTDDYAVMVRARGGLIPATIDECAELLDLCDRVEQTADNVRWMTIARAKELFDSPADWLAWVMEHYRNYKTKSNIHHIHQVGEFLLQHAKGVARHTLFALPFRKLQPVCRLPVNLVEPFLDKVDVQSLDRDEIRARVNAWLKAAGEPPIEDTERGGGRQKARQLDFLDALFAATEEDPHAFQERLTARAASVGTTEARQAVTRSIQIVDAMIPRLDRNSPEVLRLVAKALRDEALAADKLASGLTAITE